MGGFELIRDDSSGPVAKYVGRVLNKKGTPEYDKWLFCVHAVLNTCNNVGRANNVDISQQIYLDDDNKLRYVWRIVLKADSEEDLRAVLNSLSEAVKNIPIPKSAIETTTVATGRRTMQGQNDRGKGVALTGQARVGPLLQGQLAASRRML